MCGERKRKETGRERRGRTESPAENKKEVVQRVEGYDVAALNRKCDEWRQGVRKKKAKLCLVNKVTNWVETCSPDPFPPRARQKSNHVEIRIKARKIC